MKQVIDIITKTPNLFSDMLLAVTSPFFPEPKFETAADGPYKFRAIVIFNQEVFEEGMKVYGMALSRLLSDYSKSVCLVECIAGSLVLIYTMPELLARFLSMHLPNLWIMTSCFHMS